MDERCIGFVEWYDRTTGTGWIVPLGRTTPVRAYRDDIEGECGSLSVDQQVSFTIELGEGRFVARHIRP
ncbi:cold shock domain-containing protein [Streptomyces sp. NPDC057939]|uniref:cold shock domain-containing protein n=1 Tax=Streptomyces sp. NPDC057939 TaxID=3346284 RepID=UPI0036F08650